MPHFEGLPPPSSHTFLAKSEGVNPPLFSYIIRNVGSTPLLLNQLGSGMLVVCFHAGFTGLGFLLFVGAWFVPLFDWLSAVRLLLGYLIR